MARTLVANTRVRTDLRRVRHVSFFLFACWLFLNPGWAFSLDQGSMEYPVKLAFLYNFTKFVEWRDSFETPRAPCFVAAIAFRIIMLCG